MTTFVLVSGSWHASWCWERIVAPLEALGHTVHAPDLLAMGADQTPPEQVGLADWAQQVADIITQCDEKVALVGHSRGGIVISSVAELVPDKIDQLIYLTAFLLPSGAALLEAFGPVLAQLDEAPMEFLDGVSRLKPHLVRDLFYNCTDDEWAKRAGGLVCDEPAGAAATPLQLTDGKFGSVSRSYIECLQDNAIPIAFQRQMQAALPCERVEAIDTDHSPFYSAPDELVAALDRLSGRA
jgi:pimeloyl-ACP methyl ester carboxylesterase